jgi:hypothetical protein
LLKQELLSLLEAAKAHIEEGEHSEAIEKIEAAIANLEDDGVETASEGDNKPQKPGKPLPGQGNNGGIRP